MKEVAAIVTMCFLCVTTVSFAQLETTEVKKSYVTPVVTKGYFSIYKNANKLNLLAGGLTIVPGSQQQISEADRSQLRLLSKGYYSIDNKATSNSAAVDNGINFSNTGNSRVIQTEAFTEVRKGYYSIGNNDKKLKK